MIVIKDTSTGNIVRVFSDAENVRFSGPNLKVGNNRYGTIRPSTHEIVIDVPRPAVPNSFFSKDELLLEIYELLQAKLNGDMTLTSGHVVGIKKAMDDVAHGKRRPKPNRKFATKSGPITATPAVLDVIDDEVDVMIILLSDHASSLQTDILAASDVDTVNIFINWPI